MSFDTALLIATLVCGLLTVLFILNLVRRAYMRALKIGLRALVVTTAISLLTAIFTIWQLVDVLHQVAFH